MSVHPQKSCIYFSNQSHNQLNRTSARKNYPAQNVMFYVRKKDIFPRIVLAGK